MATLTNAELKLKQAALAALSRARLTVVEGDYTRALAQLRIVLDSLELAIEHKEERKGTNERART